MAKIQDGRSDDDADDQILQGGDDPDAAAARHVAGPVVLPDECRTCLPERIDKDIAKNIQIERRRHCRHDIRAKAVDRRLDHDVRQTEDRRLQPGRCADAKDLP